MTREEMIEQLEKQNGKDWVAERESDIPILEEVIKTMQTEPCEDAISRQAVNNLRRYRYNCGDTSIVCVPLKYINELPSVHPKHRTGHWIKKMVRGSEELYCSNCGDGIDVIYEYNFCPNCGANMEEGE